MDIINTYSDYERELSRQIGPRLTERILDHAARNPNISLNELIQLTKIAYPNDGDF